MCPDTKHLEGATETDQFPPPHQGQQNVSGHALRQPTASSVNYDATSPPAEGAGAAPPFTVAHVGGDWPHESYPSEEKKSDKERVSHSAPPPHIFIYFAATIFAFCSPPERQDSSICQSHGGCTGSYCSIPQHLCILRCW